MDKEIQKQIKSIQSAWRYTCLQILKRLVIERCPELLNEAMTLASEEIKNHPKYKLLQTKRGEK